jgi:hypothetical protein
VTYASECEAARAGQSIAHTGRCGSGEAASCAGFVGAVCPAGTTCTFPAGVCLVTDASGVCVKVPETCPADGDPVCACNGVTYANECAALLAGNLALDHEGSCE